MKALIVVDYQNDLVTGPFGSEKAVAMEDGICSLIERALSEGREVIFTMLAHTDRYLETSEGRKNPEPYCIEGTDGFLVHGRVNDYIPKGHILRKKNLAREMSVLPMDNYEDIEICGVNAERNILATAVVVKARNPESRVAVIRDCVASHDKRQGAKALAALKGLDIDLV